MDPLSLTLGSTVAALIATATESAGKTIGAGMTTAAAAALRKVVDLVRGRFRDGNDAAAEQALTQAEEVPDSPNRLAALAAAVDRHAADNAWRDELQRAVEEIKGAGLDVRTITQSAWGNQNVQIAGVSDSSIDVSFDRPTE